MSKATRRAGGTALVALAMLLLPAVANASFVGASTNPADSSCGKAGFTTIQAAITAATPGETITVCAGTYAEQLTIEKEVSFVGKGHPLVTLPASPALDTTTCDKEVETATGEGDEDLVSICGAVKVAITSINFEAHFNSGACSPHRFGILAAGGATLEATKVAVDGASDVPLNGCQNGVAIQIGEGKSGLDMIGHGTFEKDTIHGFQKDGIDFDAAGSTGSVTKTKIEGAGEAPTAQNGIEVIRGASATITGVTVSKDECRINHVCGGSLPDAAEWEEDATGVLIYETSAPVSVTHSKLVDNDIGIESGEATSVTLSENKITSGIGSIVLAEGSQTALSDNKLKESLYGLVFAKLEGGMTGPTATSTGDKITGQQAAIQVDKSLSPLVGSLTLSGSKVNGFINNDDPNFTITGT